MPEGPLVSVVVPVWRDADVLGRTLSRLETPSNAEVIVAVALGDESRYEGVRHQHPRVRWISAPRGRASQMNGGAAIAGGRWLLFLHADSELPADWIDTIAALDARQDVAAGAFRLALDSADWRARIIEAGARLRVALAGLPYGDQGLFIRQRVFTTLGGYRDLPLMEDVDLVRRARAAGRLVLSRSAVRTSSRRWERDGWFRRTAQNASLATRYLLGASPAQLAQRYFGRKATAIVMMARAPWTGGKTRLGADLDDAAHAALRHALFLDTLDVMASVAEAEHIIACEPADACERMRDLAGPAIDVIAQRGNDLGQRMAHVFEDAFRLGMDSVVVIGSDLPDLAPRLVREAVMALGGREQRVVLGPAADGGYYLIGLNRRHAAMFDGIDWSTERVLDQTLAAARTLALRVVLLDPWTDVDDAASLKRVLTTSQGLSACRTRAWGLEHRGQLPAADLPLAQRALCDKRPGCGSA